MSQWQTISTAPKVEHQDLIVFNGRVLAAQWWEGSWIDSTHDYLSPQPFLWQHLPPPPTAQPEIQKGNEDLVPMVKCDRCDGWGVVEVNEPGESGNETCPRCMGEGRVGV